MNSEAYIKQQIELFLKENNLNLEVVLQHPKDPKFGDYSCNIAMQLARSLKKNPRIIAQEIIDFIQLEPNYISKMEIAGAGFINFFASSDNLFEQFVQIFKQKENFGHTKQTKTPKALVEFVSANPTGPLTIGHGRQAVLGDTVANILEASGYNVTREYYFNNAGRQMRVLGESVQLRYKEICGETISFPEDYYQGEYIKDIAQKLYDAHGTALLEGDHLATFSAAAEKEIFEDIKQTILNLGFKFDHFYNERSLYDDGKIDAIKENLNSKGLVYEKEGAVWFKTSELGFDQDRVIVKSSGEPTYRLPDMAYHVEKYRRGYDLIVDIFGADHIDTYPDVMAALKALGYNTEKMKVLIHQFVTLMENGQIVKMSTRKANFVTLDDLVELIGADVTRYFFIMRGMKTHLNFDMGLAKTQSDENPVYYIQYAHARICSILALAKTQNIAPADAQSDLSATLSKKEERALIKELIMLPEAVQKTAEVLEPQRLVNYLFNLASVFHKFYSECRVLTDDEALSRARLSLIDATRIVIANTLKILGLSAPERM